VTNNAIYHQAKDVLKALYLLPFALFFCFGVNFHWLDGYFAQLFQRAFIIPTNCAGHAAQVSIS
jgi:hypothetical protein